MSVCDPTQTIPSYETINNIQCVSLETDYLDVGTLVINGVNLATLDFATAVQRTQNQSTTTPPRLTSFTGVLNIPTLSTKNIGACTITGDMTYSTALTCSSTLATAPTTASTSILMSALQPNLTAPNSVSLFLGAANSTNNGATFTFNYVGLGSASNNITIKIVGGTAQLNMNNTTTTYTGDLLVGTRILSPLVISTVYNFANNQTSDALSWAATSNVTRVELNFVELVRRNPATGDSVVQFGYNNNWLTATSGNYVGTTMSYQASPVQSAFWNGNVGIPLSASWSTGGTYGTFYFSGKMVINYMGLVSGIQVWAIYGGICTPNIVNVAGTNYGPYNMKFCGHVYGSATYPTLNMVRVTNVVSGEIFESGGLSISTS